MPVKKEEIEALFRQTEDVFNEWLIKKGIVAEIDRDSRVVTVGGVLDAKLKERIALIKKYIEEQRLALEKYESKQKPPELFVAYQKAIFLRQNFLIDAIKSIEPQAASSIVLNEAMLQLIQDDLIEAGLAVPAPSVTPSLVAAARPAMPRLTSVKAKPVKKVRSPESAPLKKTNQKHKTHPAQSSIDAFKLQQKLNDIQSQFEATCNQFRSILQNKGAIAEIASNTSLYDKQVNIENLIKAQLAEIQGFAPRDNPVTQKGLDTLRDRQSLLRKKIQGFKNQLRIEPLRAGSKNLFSRLKTPFAGLFEPKQSGFFVRFLEESRAKNLVLKKPVQLPVTPEPENFPKMKFSIDPKYATPLLGDLTGLLFSEPDDFGEYAEKLQPENKTLIDRVKKSGNSVSKKIIVQDESKKDTAEKIFVLKRAFGDQKPLAKICYSPISTANGVLFDVSIYLLSDAAKLCTTGKDQGFAEGLAALLKKYWDNQSLLAFEHFPEDSKTVDALRDARWHAIPDPTKSSVDKAPTTTTPPLVEAVIMPVIPIVSSALAAAPKTSDVPAANDDAKSVTSEFSLESLKSRETMETPSEFDSSKLNDVAGSASDKDEFEDVSLSDPDLQSVSSLDSAVPAERDEKSHITLFPEGEPPIENADLTAANLNALPNAQHTFFAEPVAQDNTNEHDRPLEEIDLGAQAKSGKTSIFRPFRRVSAFLGGLSNRLPNVRNILGTVQAGTTQKKGLKGDPNRVRDSLVKRLGKAKKGIEEGLNRASHGAKDKRETVGKSLQKKPPIPHTKVLPNGIPRNDFSSFVLGSDSLGEELKTVQEQFESAQALEQKSNTLTFRAVLANPMNSELNDTISLDPNDWEDPSFSKAPKFRAKTAPEAFDNVFKETEQSIAKSKKLLKNNEKNAKKKRVGVKDTTSGLIEAAFYGELRTERSKKDNPNQFNVFKGSDKIITITKHKKDMKVPEDQDALSVASAAKDPNEQIVNLMLHDMWLAKRKDHDKTVLIEGCEHDPALALRFYMGCIIKGLKPAFPSLPDNTEKYINENPQLATIYQALKANTGPYEEAVLALKRAEFAKKIAITPKSRKKTKEDFIEKQTAKNLVKNNLIDQKKALAQFRQATEETNNPAERPHI